MAMLPMYNVASDKYSGNLYHKYSVLSIFNYYFELILSYSCKNNY